MQKTVEQLADEVAAKLKDGKTKSSVNLLATMVARRYNGYKSPNLASKICSVLGRRGATVKASKKPR